MSPQKPNHVHVCGETTFGAPFGDIHSVTAVALPGIGHEPHLHVRFCYGLSLDLTPTAAAELARRIPEALSHLPVGGQ